MENLTDEKFAEKVYEDRTKLGLPKEPTLRDHIIFWRDSMNPVRLGNLFGNFEIYSPGEIERLYGERASPFINLIGSLITPFIVPFLLAYASSFVFTPQHYSEEERENKTHVENFYARNAVDYNQNGEIETWEKVKFLEEKGMESGILINGDLEYKLIKSYEESQK